ncbi:hypothetical protein C0J52_12925 [Blattella germanica]|nr:hypothetical protein C0J52_12925 [Blattella germanica]
MAGEKPQEDEVKYIQQGAKPKKKRRAPLPPQPSPAKTPADSQQSNSNDVEITVTAPASSNCIQEPTTHKESTSERPDPEAKAKGLPEKEDQESHAPPEEENPHCVDTGKVEDTPLEEQKNGEASESLEIKEESKVEEPPLSDEINKFTKKSSIVGLNTESSRLEIPTSEEQEKDVENQTFEKGQDITKEEKAVQESTDHHLNGMNGRHNSDEHLKVNFDVVLHISEEDLRDKENSNENESKNYSTGIENGNIENEKEEFDNKEREDTHKLQNGGKALYNSEVLQNEMQLNDKNMNETSAKAPEPKPRTILQIKE